MVLPLHLTALAGYLAAWAMQLAEFRAPKAAGGSPGRFLIPAWGAAALHAAGLAVLTVVQDGVPLVGLGPASSSLALAIALVYLGAAVRAEARPAGLFVLPCVLLLLAEGSLVGLERAVPEIAFRGPWLVLHVASIFVGYGGLLLASAASAMYLLQFRALKRKEFGSVFRIFPSLESLDGLNGVGLLIGFPGLVVGLITGWSFTLTYGRGLALGDPEVVLGLVTAAAYLAAIVARVTGSGQGRRAARAGVAAFAVTLATFLALRSATSASGFFL